MQLAYKFILFVTYFCLYNSISAVAQKRIYLDPGTIYHQDSRFVKTKEILAEYGYSLIVTRTLNHMQNPYLIISCEIKEKHLGVFRNNRRIKPVLVILEPQIIKPISYLKKHHGLFHKVYTWRDDLVDNKKYFKKFHHVMRPMAEQQSIAFENKKFCVLINKDKDGKNRRGELYTERKRVINFYQSHHQQEFDLYGRGWRKEKYPAYKGSVKDKIACVSQYKFCICYENSVDQLGYVTEKIFDCFVAGTIPLYLGAPNITQYVPKNCFIDRRDFKDNAAVYKFMKDMSRDTYEEYRANIKRFLASDQASVFARDNFIPFFIAIIRDAEKAVYGI